MQSSDVFIYLRGVNAVEQNPFSVIISHSVMK